MSIPNPNPNIADGMKCDNKTYSSNKIEQLVSSAGGDDPRLPDAVVGDIGKVLGIISDGAAGAEYGPISIPHDAVIIEFPDDYPEDIESLPEGVTGEYIYNLVHAGKMVVLACGADYYDGDGRFLIPVYNVNKKYDTYTARACLVIPQFSGNPASLTYIGCYQITISNNTVHSHYEYFNPTQQPSSEKFVATITYDADNETYTSDKTYSEIQTAVNAGKMVYVDASDCTDAQYTLGLIPYAGFYDGKIHFRCVAHMLSNIDVVEAFTMETSSSPMFANESYYYVTTDN